MTVDEIQLGLTPERVTIDSVFTLRRPQEEYCAKGKKIYMCFVDLEKTIDRIPRKMQEWAMRKKIKPEVITRSVREQRQASEWILICQRSLGLKWGCTIDLCGHIFFCSGG